MTPPHRLPRAYLCVCTHSPNHTKGGASVPSYNCANQVWRSFFGGEHGCTHTAIHLCTGRDTQSREHVRSTGNVRVRERESAQERRHGCASGNGEWEWHTHRYGSHPVVSHVVNTRSARRLVLGDPANRASERLVSGSTVFAMSVAQTAVKFAAYASSGESMHHTRAPTIACKGIQHNDVLEMCCSH